MNNLQAGFCRMNINPMLGIGVAGYFVPRYASAILDDLELSVLALKSGDDLAILISADNEGFGQCVVNRYRAAIAEKNGIRPEQIFLHATHTHTGPLTHHTEMFEVDDAPIEKYCAFLEDRMVDAVHLAIADLKQARMGFIVGWAPERVAYIRRYKMKDGSTWTCPPINDPNIDHPIGTLDQRVNVLRFDRDGGDTIVLYNYGLHADTINSDMISPDWPGWTRKTFETAVPGTKCIFFNGAEGDVGSTHVYPCGGDMNDTEISFDNEMKSPGMCRFVGRALAGTLLQVYDKVEYVDVESLSILHRIVTVPSNMPTAKEMPRAREYYDLHVAGRDCDIPYTAMELTTVVAEAQRMVRLEKGPDHFDLEMTGVRIGPVAMIGVPGEPFTDIGVQIKDTEGYAAILPCCLVNGNEGYFPMHDAFDEGGYEARSSNYKSGVAEALIDGGKKLLGSLSE